MKKLEVDTDLIRKLADLLVETGLTEIELGEGERRIRIARNGAVTLAPRVENAPPPVPAGEAVTSSAEAEQPAGAVNSPMVGTVFVAPEPGALPFINVGDEVSEGQTLFIIEAMKVMNPIRAPRAGKVSRILVSNGDPVEYGEALVIIE